MNPLITSPFASSTRANPRVLFVVPGNGLGNSMIFVRRQAESMEAEGIETNLFFLSSRTSPRHLLAEYRRFRTEVARLRPAVVHAQYGTVTALFAALGSGSLPLIITYRGSDLNPTPPSAPLRARMRAASGRLFSQLAALRAKRIVCVSRQLQTRLWWRHQIVTVMPTGVEPATFFPEPRVLARQRVGWDREERVVLFNAGNDSRVKRLELAQAAVAWAHRFVPTLRMEILDGSVDPSRLPQLMNAADCLLLTSIFEGSPTVVQEALACDLPIVSVDAGDVRERFEGVRNAVIAGCDIHALGRAIVNMVEPPRRSNGSAKVGEFSSQSIALQLKNIYLELIAA